MTTHVALEARGLSRAFGGEPAVQDVHLKVRNGEIHALVGLNGAGKTTLMRLLLAMVRPDAGEAFVNGVPVSGHSPVNWSRVGALIETPLAYPELTVTANLTAAALLHGVPNEQIDTAVEQAIERLGLQRWRNRRSRVLSLGNRQRLGLASALVHRPTVLLLDEPANALDPAGVVFIRDLLSRSAAAGMAILVSSHHLDQLARVAHTITVLHRGRVVGSLEPGGVDLERQFFDLVNAVELSWSGGTS